MSETSRPASNPMAPLGRLLNSTLTVADIVSAPLWSIPSTMPSSDAVNAMRNHSFDIAGVAPEPPRLYVYRADLEAAIQEGKESEDVARYAKSIPASQCVEKSLPISALLELFETNERLFVLDGNSVRWVVTHADLTAPAVSVAVLSFLTVIEAGIKQLASYMSDEQVVALLPPKRQERVRQLHHQREQQGIETSLRDCLFLEDWLTVVKETTELLRNVGYGSKNSLADSTGSFGRMRNDLAHGRDLFSDPDVEIRAVLDRVKRIRAFSAAVWQAVEHRRPIWDQYSSTIIETHGPDVVQLTGTSAVAAWPYEGDVYVVTGWNPGSVWVSAHRNDEANRRLRESLERRGARLAPAVGRSPDGAWSEDSFLIEGISGPVVAELAALYGQTAYFHLDSDAVRVCDSVTMAAVRTVPRRAD